MQETTLLKLLDAGFDKDEILSLAGKPAEPQQKQQQEPKQKPAEDVPPKPEEKTEPQTNVTLSDTQFTQLMQKLNAAGASMDVPPDRDINKALGDHFKDLLIGG